MNIAGDYTRKEFFDIIKQYKSDRFICPHHYHLESYYSEHGECVGIECLKCWERATENVKFKDEIKKRNRK